MNKKLKKLLKRTGIAATGIVAFAGAVIGGYVLTPNRSKLIDVSVQEREKTLFERFVEKLTKDVGMNEEESGEEEVESFLSAKFAGLTSTEKFQITYKKDKDSVLNTISIEEGEIDFRMSALAMSAIEFNVDLDVNYNGKYLPITLGHFGNEMYFGLKDLKMKMTDFNLENLSTKYLLAFATYANLNSTSLFSDLGTLINEKLGGVFDSLLNGEIGGSEASANEAKNDQNEESEEAGFDFSSLLSNSPKESKKGDDTVFSLGETEKVGGLVINLVADSDLSLKRVELENLSFGTVTINGAIDVEIKPYDSFVSPTLDGYVEVFNYTSLTGKLLSVLKEGNQKFGLEFALNLDNVVESVITDIARVEGSINIDFDKLLDLSQYHIFNESPKPDDYKMVGELKDVGFNLQLDLIGQNNVEYANLDLVFANGEGYLRFNEQDDGNGNLESVMKLYFDTETMNWIMSKVPELIDNLSQDSGTDTMETLSKFLSEDLVDSINNFDFSFILDMLKTLKNDASGFELGIDLSALNIGENAEVVIRVNNDADYFKDYFDLEATITALNNKSELTAEEEAELEAAIASFQEEMAKVNNSGLDVKVRGLAFGNFTLEAEMNTTPFSEPDLGEASLYQSTKFIPDVVEQVTELANTKKTGFKIYGSMLDDANLGIRFNGQGCLDNTDEVKEGFGNMTIKQYKYSGNQVWATHDMYVNVTNLASNILEYDAVDSNGNTVKKKNNQNEALFIYGNPDDANNSVKGKMKLQTFADLIDVVMTFIDEEGNNPKYTKFLEPITKLLGMNTLGSIIDSKDYLYFASNNILKKIDITEGVDGTEIKIVVNKNMLGMNLPADIAISINTKVNGEGKQELHSLVIKDLVLSDKENASKLNLTFELEDYDNGTENRIHKGDTFMSLDGIKTLLQLGINTTKVNFYHLTAEALIRLGSTSIIKPDLKGINFYVYVDGVHVKVFGTIDEIPTIIAITVDDALGTKKTGAEFSFETYDDDNNDNKVGGIFNIRRFFKSDDSETKWISLFKWETHYYHVRDYYHYRCDSQNFLDNIAQYLITGLIGIKPSIYLDALNEENSDSSEYKEPGNFTNTFTSTGFQSYKQNGNDVIKVGLNLNELTGINALKEVEATITSQHIDYQGSSEGMDVIGSLHATMRINFATIFNINITLDAAVKEAVVPQAQALTRWNAKASEGFADITTHAIANAYYNNPNNPATYTTRTEYYK
ncbi:MAG: hypothetical protein IJQ72_02140 [Bacilli bacterium]|nr:hypothetical protein [Bacilli bacterium]